MALEKEDRFGESISIVMRGKTRAAMVADGGGRSFGKGEKKEREGNEFEREGRKSHVLVLLRYNWWWISRSIYRAKC